MFAWLLSVTSAWPIPPGPAVPPLCLPCDCAARSVPPAAIEAATELDTEQKLERVEREPTSAPSRWYGGPAVVADVLSFTMIGGGGAANRVEILLLGTAGFAFGAPINHLANGHPGRALASFGIRALGAGAATGVFLMDVLSRSCHGNEGSCDGFPAFGLAAGAAFLITAMAIDDAVLARETRQPARSRPARANLVPALVVAPSLAFASLGGRF